MTLTLSFGEKQKKPKETWALADLNQYFRTQWMQGLGDCKYILTNLLKATNIADIYEVLLSTGTCINSFEPFQQPCGTSTVISTVYKGAIEAQRLYIWWGCMLLRAIRTQASKDTFALTLTPSSFPKRELVTGAFCFYLPSALCSKQSLQLYVNYTVCTI